VLEKLGGPAFLLGLPIPVKKKSEWVAEASYSSFHEGDLTRLGDEKILKLMRRLTTRAITYEILQLPYTIGGDTAPGPPDSGFVKVGTTGMSPRG